MPPPKFLPAKLPPAKLLPPNWPELSPDQIAQLAPTQRLNHPVFAKSGLNVFIKREDYLDPLVGGNKVYKLYGHLTAWREQFSDFPIASFGGAFSNHILALATVGRALGIKTIGVIRGEEPPKLSPTLQDAKHLGMRLYFISRSEYRAKQEMAIKALIEYKTGKAYWVPEGGGGFAGLIGCTALGKAIVASGDVDVICHACGTGASLAGIACGAGTRAKVLGVPVLKGSLAPMRADIAHWIKACSEECSIHWELAEGFHCGGYGKRPEYLRNFIVDFQKSYGISLDAVYTAKLMRAVLHLAESGFWPGGTSIVIIHSGGIQGNRGFNWEK